MNHTQISVAIRNPLNTSNNSVAPPYFFLFRTEWMEPDLADIALQQILERFPKPDFRITFYSRHTSTIMQDL